MGLTCYPLLTVIKALLRRTDRKILIMLVVGVSALSLDRSNVNQANSTNFLSDLNLTTDGDSGQSSTRHRVSNDR
jgi:hypothetical protein